MNRYQSMGSPALPAFADTVEKYLAFNWRHLNLEEAELLPWRGKH